MTKSFTGPFRIIATLGVITAGCCGCTNFSSHDKDLPPIISQAGHTMVPPLAFDQLVAGRRSVAGQTRHPVYSITAGLPYVRMVSQNPIVALTEQDGWFFYATSVVRDEVTNQPVQFISGYAIKRGGREIVHWSTW